MAIGVEQRSRLGGMWEAARSLSMALLVVCLSVLVAPSASASTDRGWDLFGLATVQPIDIEQCRVIPARTMQTTQFCDCKPGLFYSTTSDLVTLLRWRHVFQNDCNIATRFIPISEVTMR